MPHRTARLRALAEILDEYPALAELTWTIDPTSPVVRGYLPRGGDITEARAALTGWAELLGVEVESAGVGADGIETLAVDGRAGSLRLSILGGGRAAKAAGIDDIAQLRNQGAEAATTSRFTGRVPTPRRWATVQAHHWDEGRTDQITPPLDYRTAVTRAADKNLNVTSADLNLGMVELLLVNDGPGWRVYEDPRLTWARPNQPRPTAPAGGAA